MFFFFSISRCEEPIFLVMESRLKVAIAPLKTGGRCRQEKLAQKKNVTTVSWDKQTKERHVVEMIAGKGSLEMYVLTMVEMKKWR